jgi:KaiC/GvpD/RAD55 family RecA-like ATPase
VNDVKEAIRFDRQALLNELIVHGAVVKGSSIKCPFHDDKNPSAGVYIGEDKVWRFKCHGCGFTGDIYDVRAKATGKNVADVLKAASDPGRPAPHVYSNFEEIFKTLEGPTESIYYYTDPKTNKVDLCVIRYIGQDGKKKFAQVMPSSGGWIKQAPASPRPLYRRKEIIQAETVIVVEGEKCVDVLNDYGIAATTSSGGSSCAGYTSWTILAGKKIILWPDNDEVGHKYMKQVQALLEKLEPQPSISWLDPASLSLDEKQDAADFVKDMASRYDFENTKEILTEALKQAKGIGFSADVAGLIEDTITGKRKAIEWPWKRFGNMTNALLPGTVTLICGDPGSTKSFFLIEALAYWYNAGIKVACYELEEDRKYHLLRALAQLTGNSHVLDCDWVKDNPEESRQAVQAQIDTLNGLGRCIWESPTAQCTLNQLAEWVEKMAKAGCRVIAIDPVTAAEPADKPWVADSRFIMRVKKAVNESGSSLILITHPKKGRKGNVGLDDLAGSAAYARASQTVVWIEYLTEYKKYNVKGDLGPFEVEANRTVYLAKTRNGRGQGFELAYRFSGETLKFAEQGIVIKEIKEKK